METMPKFFEDCFSYEEEIQRLKDRESLLTKKAQILFDLSRFLSAEDTETPDITIVDFISAKYPEWEKLLPRQIIEKVCSYAYDAEDDKLISKEALQRLIGKASEETLKARSKTHFLLADCPEEIEKKIYDCEARKKALIEQIQLLSERIGQITAEELFWQEILKEVDNY